MKTKPLYLFMVVAAALSLTLVACEKSNPIESIDDPTSQVTISEVEEQIASLPDYEAELLKAPVLQEMTEDVEMEILIDGAPTDLEDPFSAAESIDSNGVRHGIFKCLDTLNLSQGQKDSVRAALFRTHQCKKSHIQAIRVINHRIIQNANQQRNQLVRQFVTGQITRAQLVRQLTQLNIQTHRLLRNNSAKQHHLLELRRCNLKFYRALHNILSPAQWQQFIHCRRGN